LWWVAPPRPAGSRALSVELVIAPEPMPSSAAEIAKPEMADPAPGPAAANASPTKIAEAAPLDRFRPTTPDLATPSMPPQAAVPPPPEAAESAPAPAAVPPMPPVRAVLVPLASTAEPDLAAAGAPSLAATRSEPRKIRAASRPLHHTRSPRPRRHERRAAPVEAVKPALVIARAEPVAAAPAAIRAVSRAATGSVSVAWQSQVAAWLERHKQYPSAARMRGEEGAVGVRVHIMRDGRVAGVAVLHPSGYASLDEAVRDMLTGQRLPPFPPEMTEPERDVSFTVRYRIDS
jgi:protein TonB